MAKKKNLVIVESPAKAKTINKILKTDYVVKASYGHVRDLPTKGGINVDLDTFEGNYEIVNDPRKQKVIADLKKTAKESSRIFLCPDPDREGEAIAFHLSEILGVPKSKFSRVTFNEITSKAIKEAFQDPRNIDMDLVNAQQARRFLDRIVGYKLTPLLWEKIFRGLSAGRVQSVAVRILAEREKDIQAFKPQEYWTVKGTFDFGKKDNVFDAELREMGGKRIVASAKDLENPKGKYHIKNRDNARAVVDNCFNCGDNERPYHVSSYVQKESKDRALPPFITSTLQQAATTRLGYAASKTMSVAQKLYENGLITYMRTDSFHVSKDAQAAAMSFIKTVLGEKYYPDKPNFYRSRKGAQEAHECIRPSNVDLVDVVKAGTDERKLYKLIWERFIASQMAPAVYKNTTCDIVSGDQVVFRTTGRVKLFEGWTRIYRVDGKDRILPEMTEGQEVQIVAVEPEQHFTQPPPRFNDASLVKTLEASGVGRPSTYASIIKTILDRKYVERTGAGGRAPLKATELGILVTDSLKDHFAIMDVAFTSGMEEKLDEVEEGKVEYKSLLARFWKDFQKELKAAKTGMPTTKDGKPTKFKCLKCKSKMSERISQYGPFFKCLSEDCGATYEKGEDGQPREKEGPKKTGLTCDICGSDMVKANGRFGEYLCCEKYLVKVEKKVEGKRKPVKVPECSFTMKLTTKGEPRRKVIPTPTDIECDKCKKGNLVIRIASRKKKPDAFLSCEKFPKCRNTEKLPEDLQKEGEKLLKEFRKLRAKDVKDLEAWKAFQEQAS